MASRCLLLAGLLCLLAGGCGSGSDVRSEIQGEWLGQVVKQDLVFHSDGRVEMRGHEHSTYVGRYSFGSGDELTCRGLHGLVRAGLNVVMLVVEPYNRFAVVQERARRLGFHAYLVASEEDLNRLQTLSGARIFAYRGVPS